MATANDAVYPDLAFSLPRFERARPPRRRAGDRVVGVGVMEYYGRGCSQEHGAPVYRDYLEKVTTFVAWLLEHGYRVRLLIGDAAYDRRVKDDVAAGLAARGVVPRHGQLVNEAISTVDDVLSELAATDTVVATRFHSVLLAVMLGKPVVSISYDPKNDSLMAGVGLAEYCQPIERLDVSRLIAQFVALEARASLLTPRLEQKADEYRGLLDEQYRSILGVA